MTRAAQAGAIAAITAITATTTLLAPAAVSAQAMGFMEYSPIAYYTDEDNRLADEAGLDALENFADNMVREWRNPETGASGSITPLETFQNEAGLTCRKARAVDRTTTPKLRAEFVFVLCKDPGKGWQFVKRK